VVDIKYENDGIILIFNSAGRFEEGLVTNRWDLHLIIIGCEWGTVAARNVVLSRSSS